MKVSIFPREATKKSDAKKVRREGNIPAILYGASGAPRTLTVQGTEWAALLRGLPSQMLATTVFELEGDGQKVRAILKEVQYHPTTYAILHLDFVELFEDRPVEVNVPIQLAGVADCAGVKLGGFIRHVIRSMKVSCLPKHLPKQFVVDVRDMAIAEEKRLSDIALPEGVRPLARLQEVAVLIAKKAG